VKYIARFGRFWYDFVVGDDWRLALGVVITTALVAVAAHHGANWWWVSPPAVAALLTMSVVKATRAG
jgi:hypothetical protein